jgi:5-methylcytosine-specific restriction endonuclease McrA
MRKDQKYIRRMRNKKFKKHNCYIRFNTYPIEQVLELINSTSQVSNKLIKFDDKYDIKLNSQRYSLFKRDGVTCVSCGIVGQYFALEKHLKTQCTRPHFNLYGINKCDEEIMLTKDHIIPKSKGGLNALSNYQVMCAECNNFKANFKDYTGEIGYRILKSSANTHEFGKWHKKTKTNLDLLTNEIITMRANTFNNVKFFIKETF